MIPTKQTKLYSGPGTCGNCLTACISSLLEIPINKIPNFVELYSNWQGALNDFLKPFNLVYIEVPAKDIKGQVELGYHLVCGFTIRSNEIPHAVVAYNEQPKHDPHPSDDFLITEDRYGLFCCLDPATSRKSSESSKSSQRPYRRRRRRNRR